MNVTLIAQLLAVLGLSGLLVTSAVTVFSSSSASMSAATPSSSMSAEDEDVVNFQHRSRRYDHQEHRKPHIIIILADDMGWNDVSFHGSDQVPTPNIDAIAYNGIVLNKHYVPALCTPSRAALMTGKYPIHLGLQHSVILPAEPRGLPLTEKLLPEYLKGEGYSTYAVGKWHLGYYEKKYTPLFRGFDTHYGYWNGLEDYYTHMAREPNPTLNISAGYDMRRNLSVDWDAAGIYSTDLFTKESVRLINAHDPKDPMFLYLAHLAPHKGNPNQPLRAPAEEIAKFSYINDPERRIHAAVMSKLDQSVGEVVDALKARGMLENSIIIFMSDNGAPTDGILSNQGSNYPFRGIKNSPWEGGVRGAAAIWSPLIKASKRVSNQLMFMADWLPTLLSAAGAKSIRLRNIDGIDLWRSLVSDEISPRTEVLINIDDISNYAAIRRGDFKYVIGETDAGSAWLGASGQSSEGISPEYKPESVLNSKAGIAIASVITTRQDRVLTADKIVELRKEAEIKCNVKEEEKIPCNPRQAACLFNIEKDPCEMVNLADNRPVILTIMEMSLLKYRVTMVPPSNMEGDPQSNPALWNNTWTCWREPDPLHLEYDNEEKPVNYSRVTIAVISVVFGLFIISMFTVYAMTCNRCRSTNLEPRELHDTQEPMVHASIVEENKERCTNVQDNTKEAVE